MHALIAGFAATIGVLVALHAWKSAAEWIERRRVRRIVRRLREQPPTPLRDRIALALWCFAALGFGVLVLAAAFPDNQPRQSTSAVAERPAACAAKDWDAFTLALCGN